MDRLFGRIRWLLVAATALAGCGTLLWMTHTLTWVGQAQSYDTMLYARSLWGAGHGHWHNPIVGTHALAIHGHFLALPLAPLTHLFRAVDVLNVAHSLSAGRTHVLNRERTQRADVAQNLQVERVVDGRQKKVDPARVRRQHNFRAMLRQVCRKAKAFDESLLMAVHGRPCGGKVVLHSRRETPKCACGGGIFGCTCCDRARVGRGHNTRRPWPPAENRLDV